MTADEQGPDTAAIRAQHQEIIQHVGVARYSSGYCICTTNSSQRNAYPCDTIKLCDALDAARTERDTALAELHNYKIVARGAYAADHRIMDKLRAELSAAQAAVVTLTAENGDLRENVSTIQLDRNDLWHELDRAKAAVVTARRDALPAQDWSGMCGESAPWQTPNAFTLCRRPAGHDGRHDRYGKAWARAEETP